MSCMIFRQHKSISIQPYTLNNNVSQRRNAYSFVDTNKEPYVEIMKKKRYDYNKTLVKQDNGQKSSSNLTFTAICSSARHLDGNPTHYLSSSATTIPLKIIITNCSLQFGLRIIVWTHGVTVGSFYHEKQ